MTENLQNLISQAQECESKKDWDGAIRCWSQVIDLPEISKEDRAKAFNSRGNAFAKKGELDTAIRDYNQALKIKPDYAEALNSRGIAFADKGELDRAIRDFDQAININPDFAEVFYNRGIAFADKGELDRAIRDFDQAIKLKPDYAKAFNNRGVAFGKKGEHYPAIRDFDDALKLKPDFAEALNNRGNAFVGKGELDRAIRDFDDALKLKPGFAGAFSNRGNAFAKKGELDRAISDFDDALDLDSDAVEALNNRGIAFGKKGKLDRAISDFDDALKLDSDNAEIHNNRGNAFAGLGEFDLAIRDFDQAIKIKPNFAAAFNNRGLAFAHKDEFDRAINDFNQAIKIKPDYEEAFHNRAVALAQIHARETGEKYKKALEAELRQVSDPEKIVKSYQRRERVYRRQIKDLDCGIILFTSLLSVILIGGFSAIAFAVSYAWQYLVFGSSDCDIPNCSAHGIVIVNCCPTNRGEVSFAGLLAIAPITLALFTACFPLIAHLFNLRKEKRRLQVCVEDYFRKQTLARYTLLAEGEHKQRLIATTHAHFATRSTAEFLAGWKQESEENSHPLTDAIAKAIRGAKDAVSSKPTEKSSS